MVSLRKKSVHLPDEYFETLKEIFGCKYEEKAVDGIKTRLTRDYYASNILKILLVLSKNSRGYSELYLKSKIRSEAAFRRYLKWMLQRGWILKDSKSKYGITEKGIKIIDAFS